MSDALVQAAGGDSAGLAGATQTPMQAPQQGGGGGDAQSNEKLQQFMEQLSKSRTQLAPMQANARAGKPGFGASAAAGLVGMFVPALGSAIMNSVKNSKESQVNSAVNDYRILAQGLEMADMSSGGDPQKRDQAFQQMPGVKEILSDKKKFKNMAKVFSEPWLADREGKGGSVYHEGLMKFLKLHKAEEQIKQLKQHMMGRQQAQGQGQPQQGQQGQGGAQPNTPQDRAQRLPMQQVPGDAAAVEKVASAREKFAQSQEQLARAQQLLREKYEFKADAQGHLVAINKSDPTDTMEIKVDGQKVTSALKGKNGIATIDGAPFGVYRNGQALTPQSPEWTANDQTLLDTANAKYASTEAAKQKRAEQVAKIRGESYAQGRAKWTVVNVGTKDGQMGYASPAEILAHPENFAAEGAVERQQRLKSQFGEIEYSANKVMDSIKAMGDDEAFSVEARAKFALVLRASDPHSAFDQFTQSEIANHISDPQLDYLTALVSLQESSMAVRALGGTTGQTSDKFRDAILKMVPGASTPSKAYALRQMSLFNGEVGAFKKSILNVGIPKAGASGSEKKRRVIDLSGAQ